MKLIEIISSHMAYRTIWESPESVRVEFFGTITYADALNATEGLYNDSRSDNVRYAFWDFSAINDFVVSEVEADEMAAMDHVASQYMKPMKAAFIIRDPKLIELAEQYIAALSDMRCQWSSKLFDNMDDARQWANS